jgi:cyclohexanone monooxygenase
VAGKEYEVDCIIYASGFEVGTPHERRSGFDMVGRDGLKLSDYWADGMRSVHGIHVHGFPNAFLVQMTQGANLLSNFPHNLTESARTVASVVRHAEDTGAHEVDVPRDVEDAWLELLRQGNGMILGSSECTPGYYNNEGQDRGAEAELAVGHPEGAVAYFNYIRQWRDSGEFEGLQFD